MQIRTPTEKRHQRPSLLQSNFDPSEGEGWGRILQSQREYLHVKHPVGRRIPWMTECEVDPALPLFDGVLHQVEDKIRCQSTGPRETRDTIFLHDNSTFFHFKYFYICLLIPDESHSLEPENCLKLRVITFT